MGKEKKSSETLLSAEQEQELFERYLPLILSKSKESGIDVHVIPSKVTGSETYERWGGTKGKNIVGKKGLPHHVLKEISLLNSIASAINTEHPYPSGVYELDSDTGFTKLDIFYHLDNNRYIKAKKLLDKYESNFFDISFLRKTEQENLLSMLHYIIDGKLDDEFVEMVPEDVFRSERLEPVIKMYVDRRGAYEFKEKEEELFKMYIFNEDYHVSLDIVVVATERKTKKNKEEDRKIVKPWTYFNRSKIPQVTQTDSLNLSQTPKLKYAGPGKKAGVPTNEGDLNFPTPFIPRR